MAQVNKLPITLTSNVGSEEFDAVVIVSKCLDELSSSESFASHYTVLNALKQVNKSFGSEVTLTVVNKQRVIYSPTGPVNRDYDDVRRIADATRLGIERAIKSGSKRPLLVNNTTSLFKLSDQVALLAALDAAHIPLEVREATKKPVDELLKVDTLGFWSENKESESLLKLINAIELGRIVTRDIGGSDPERMSAAKVLDYVNDTFKSTDIKIEVVEGQEEFEKNYPCFAAVNRAANVIERHRGRIIKLEYSTNEAPIDTTLFLVGKGINYDTGGADIKYGGHMAGMHRDKCGAAFVAGFFKTLTLLKPKGLKVFGYLCLARNSVGEESYVSDEIITARSQMRLRIGNTDAEGRMVMCDLLCESKEKALNEVNPQLFTIATLTGHVIRAYGPNYTAVLSNGPARALKIDQNLSNAGHEIADPYEISTLRREDYEMVAGRSEYEDLLQSTSNPSTAESRGHQFPAAFLVRASGLDKHGSDSDKQLPYSHVDIAGSSGPFPGKPTGSPLPSFVYTYVVPRL